MKQEKQVLTQKVVVTLPLEKATVLQHLAERRGLTLPMLCRLIMSEYAAGQ